MRVQADRDVCIQAGNCVMVADAAYLETAHVAAAEHYGDRAGYLRHGLGLNDATIERVRTRLRG